MRHFLCFLIFCQENVEDWLTELGLDEYWENFTQSGYTEPRMLEDLKLMNKEELKETFRIIKPGHLDKMYKAIQKVQYPSEGRCFCYPNSHSTLMVSAKHLALGSRMSSRTGGCFVVLLQTTLYAQSVFLSSRSIVGQFRYVKILTWL